MSLSRAEVIHRLTEVGNSYDRNHTPDFLSRPGAWVEPLAEMAREALALIEPFSGQHLSKLSLPERLEGFARECAESNMPVEVAELRAAALALSRFQWQPIGDAPVPSAEQLIEERQITGYAWPCLIQDKSGRVTSGLAKYGRKQGYARDAKGAEVYELRWYSHLTGWVQNAKYFMPMPAPRED